ncbi:MAG: glycosyltransferase [Lachnospiraceae bacterium]|nr:glycosyltransferase [Lachnospiraceae bacterium]
MIPKKIHYCWFGRGKKPKMALRCVKSWEKFCPNYEIVEWNEDNFDVNCCEYTKEAYKAKKYAFVSDYARYQILYKNGGVYFDTDVELIRAIDDIVEKGNFMGYETDGSNFADRIQSPMYTGEVNPGLGIAAVPGLHIYKEILDYYHTLNFIMSDGSLNTKTVVAYTTEILLKHGMKDMREIQKVDGIWIYPKEYFNPRNNNTGKLEITKNTKSIHWYSMSWLPKHKAMLVNVTRICHRLFGEDCFSRLKEIINNRNKE